MASIIKKSIFTLVFVAVVACIAYAANWMNGASGSAPASGGDVSTQAAALIKAGKSSEAVTLLEGALQKQKGDENLLVMLGSVYVDNKDFEKAAQAYKQALSANPSSGRAYLGLGTVSLKQGNVAGAIQNFTAAMKADPRNPDSYFQMGNMALGSNQLNVAMGFYQKALAVDKEHKPTLAILARIRQIADKARATQAAKS